MPKSKVVDEQYIRIEPSKQYAWDPDLGDMVRSIIRHVDGCSRNNVDIITEHKFVCSFCGARWTEDDVDYNGGCCDKDEKNAPPMFTRE